jgi:hypothetical protein
MPAEKPSLGMPKDIWASLPKSAKDWLQGFDKGLVKAPASHISYPGSTGFQAAERAVAVDSNSADLTKWHNDPNKTLVEMAKDLIPPGETNSVYDLLTPDERRILELISADTDASQLIKDATKDFLADAARLKKPLADMPVKTTRSGVTWRLPIDCAIMNAGLATGAEVKPVKSRSGSRVSITPLPKIAGFS